MYYFVKNRAPLTSPLFPYTTLFRSRGRGRRDRARHLLLQRVELLADRANERSEEHTSELQSRRDLVCRLLLEKKNIDQHRVLDTVYPLAYHANQLYELSNKILRLLL